MCELYGVPIGASVLIDSDFNASEIFKSWLLVLQKS